LDCVVEVDLTVVAVPWDEGGDLLARFAGGVLNPRDDFFLLIGERRKGSSTPFFVVPERPPPERTVPPERSPPIERDGLDVIALPPGDDCFDLKERGSVDFVFIFIQGDEL
jgi:hypothetical protein